MISVGCEKCGESFPAGAPHECAPVPPHNDNHDDRPPRGRFDAKAWRKHYMREYMRRKRERLRRDKDCA